MGNQLAKILQPPLDQLTGIESPPMKGKLVDCYVTDVYDGDTVTVIYYAHVRYPAPFLCKVRLAGIDTPEIRTTNDLEKQAGYIIRDYVIDLIHEKCLKLEVLDWDKYGGRIIGKIFLSPDHNLSELLISKCLAKPYNGRTRKEPWSDSELQYIVDSESSIIADTLID